MKQNYTREDVPLARILLSERNPRVDPTESQRQALDVLFEAEGKSLVDLAGDMQVYDLNPSDLPIVTETADGWYVAQEGNRRIATLMCLAEPELAPTTFRKAFERVAKKMDVPREVFCVVHRDAEHVRHWVEIKHTARKPGSTRPWNARQRRRFERAPDPALLLMDWLRTNATRDVVERYDRSKGIISNIERLIKDKDARVVLGVQIEKGSVLRTASVPALVRAFSRIVRDFTDPDPDRRKKVAAIYNKSERAKYLAEIKDDLPVEKDRLRTPVRLSEVDPAPPAHQPKPATPRPPDWHMPDRDALVHGRARFQTGDRRLDMIFQELKRLKVKRTPNACALMLRSFLEMSAAYYCSRSGLKVETGQGAFSGNVSRAIGHMKETKLLTAPQGKAMDSLCTKDGGALTYARMHEWVHNSSAHPLIEDMFRMWDICWPFLGIVGQIESRQK